MPSDRISRNAVLPSVRVATALPPIIRQAGRTASKRFLEFFTAQIRNRNTREAYHRALVDFLAWCADRSCRLEQIEPILVAAFRKNKSSDGLRGGAI